jgi:hypothetical protein
MPRSKQRFTEREFRRALRAAHKERVPVRSAEIDRDGRIVVSFGPPRDDPAEPATDSNPWPKEIETLAEEKP